MTMRVTTALGSCLIYAHGQSLVYGTELGSGGRVLASWKEMEYWNWGWIEMELEMEMEMEMEMGRDDSGGITTAAEGAARYTT